ncbi:hypothetical protein O7627_06050 [Solwaraspora sp. WMMD1047]|uniref:hypothetical protein n=1 Tax=Solwaraspora sp. WMMD1047 TaxID=3016102 RepID=UPI002415B63F|nr:hypothetical protein [Solwaraspora sp. WMMD1047]MDG4828867.1 hypothetical protein [Solwaraspora sp. WMMD1047]
MAKKFLGKMVAGAALGGASLLIGAPGIALADGPTPAPEPAPEEVNKIFTYPEWVKAGHKVKIVEICEEAQDAPWAWTEITGEVDLVPKKHGDKWGEEGSWGDEGSWGEEEGSWGGSNGAEEEGGWGGSAKDDAADKKEPKADAEDAAAAEEGKKDEHHEKDEKFVYYATVKIPWDTTPGHYELVGQCAEGELKVAPKGWVHGGDGGSTGANTALATSGAGLLGAAALGGVMLMRRRTNGTLA